MRIRQRKKVTRLIQAGGKRPDLENMYFRSAWEANWARYLSFLKKHGEILFWEYEAETFNFDKIQRGSTHYTPDFRVTNIDYTIEYHEIKGYMDQPSRTKLKRMKKYYPHANIIVIDRKQYVAVARKVGGLIPNWE